MLRAKFLRCFVALCAVMSLCSVFAQALPAFNITQTYTTVVDIDGKVYAYQNNYYYDQQGNTWTSLPRSKNGYAPVSMPTSSGSGVDTSYVVLVSPAGNTYTMLQGTQTVVIVPSAPLSVFNINLPQCNAAYNGYLARFSTTLPITNLTVNAAPSSVVAGPGSATAGQGFGFICVGVAATWYRLY